MLCWAKNELLDYVNIPLINLIATCRIFLIINLSFLIMKFDLHSDLVSEVIKTNYNKIPENLFFYIIIHLFWSKLFDNWHYN